MSDMFNEDEKGEIVERAKSLFELLKLLDVPTKIEAINGIRFALHAHSPFSGEPVDCVQWINADEVTANDYNPNSVAPPEMKLLEHSITSDGYTQPIVAWRNGDKFEVIDGFHRNRVGKESKTVRKRVHGYLPLTIINDSRTDKNDRVASTIRHNRARGKHKVEAMADIVIELKRRNWNDEKIGRELGMDPDEVLRLTQITGLAEMFSNQEFNTAWDIESDQGAGGEVLSDLSEEDGKPQSGRILHTWDKWECYRAGFYDDRPKGMTQEDGEERYREFLADLDTFEKSLQTITSEWKYSCEHYLTNDRMNRIAWLGQAAVAHALGIPSVCRTGYHRLEAEQRYKADQMALKYLNKWRVSRGLNQLMLADAQSKTEADLY